MHNFPEIVSRKMTADTVKHCGGDLVIVKHRDIGGNFDGCNNTITDYV